MHRVPAADVLVTVLFAVTVIVPVVVITPQPPVSVTVYVNALLLLSGYR